MSDLPPPPLPPPSQPQRVAPQAPRNGLGITALILGIVGVLTGLVPFVFWIGGIAGAVGLILGLIGYARFQRGAARNGSIALAGITTSAIAMIFSIAGAAIYVGLFTDLGKQLLADTASRPTHPPTSAQATETSPAETEQVDVYDLKVGDCIREFPDGDEMISSLPTVPCSEPHSDEIFAAVNLPEVDGDFPGDDVIGTQAEDLCSAEFEAFVGLSFDESVLNFGLITPSEESWREGDRLVLCTLFDPSGDVTGSLRGAGR